MTDVIVLETPDGKSRPVPLTGPRLRVGRLAHENDLIVDEATLSRRHLVLERDPSGWTVKDVEPKNPTLLNGVPLVGRQRLRTGDKIEAGKVVLWFGERAKAASGAEWFTPDGVSESMGATHVTSLREVMSGERSSADERGRPRQAVQLPLDNPAVMALLTAGRELVGHRPVDELFPLILDLSIGAVGADRGALLTLDNDSAEIRAVRGEGFRVSTTIRDRVLCERTSILVSDVRLDDELRNRQSIHEQDIRSMMAVPLQTNQDVLGMILVASLVHGVRFERADLDLLTVLGNVAAIRLEQARLLRMEEEQRFLARELDQAAEIQRRLLPAAAPEVAGFEIAGYNAPCRTVGGDYYDYFSYPDGRIAVVLGDVAGKGLPAALLMTSIKGGVQVLAEVTDDLADLMDRLDRAVAATFPSNRFVSLVIAVLEPSTGRLTYCSAGHNPPILMRASGAVERLFPGGAVLGAQTGLPYQQDRTRLEPGDLLALFSDGIVEAVNETGEEFGDDHLIATLRAVRERGAAAAVDAALEAVANWSAGHAPEDDITMVAVARRP